MILHDCTSVGAPQQRRIRCSFAADQLVTLWFQRHFIRGIGGETFSLSARRMCSVSAKAPARTACARPVRREDSDSSRHCAGAVGLS